MNTTTKTVCTEDIASHYVESCGSKLGYIYSINIEYSIHPI